MQSSEIKLLSDFQKSVKAELQIQTDNLLTEFKGRKEQLIRIAATKEAEYNIMWNIVTINNSILNGTPETATILSIQEILSDLTLSKARTSMTLAFWSTNLGTLATSIVSDILLYFLRQINVKQSLTDIQILTCSVKIIKEYRTLRFIELLHCLNMGVSNHFGNSYQYIGVETIMEWIHKYLELQDADIVAYNTRYRGENRIRVEDIVSPEEKKLEAYKNEMMAKIDIDKSLKNK